MVLMITLLAVGQASSAVFSQESACSRPHLLKSALGLHILRFNQHAPLPILSSHEGIVKPNAKWAICCAIVQQVLQV